ncbi:MAG: hypothetical protein ACL7BU_06180 [Candidatus Phlomobacter fragariae]
MGLGIACLLPVLALIKLNEKDKNIYGNAKFSPLKKKNTAILRSMGMRKMALLLGH